MKSINQDSIKSNALRNKKHYCFIGITLLLFMGSFTSPIFAKSRVNSSKVANLVSNGADKGTAKNSNFEIKGVILKDGVLELKQSEGIAEVIIRKQHKQHYNILYLIVKVFDNNEKEIAQTKMMLNTDLEPGIQSVKLDSVLFFKNASHIMAFIVDQNNQIIAKNSDRIVSGSYKHTPLFQNWITNANYGIGPSVMNPEKVPAGIDVNLIDTKKLNVNYKYNKSYPTVKANNVMWFKTGAYNASSSIYDRDGADWEQQALPIGNGHLGAMIFGMPGKDHIQFNEETFWAAGYKGVQNKRNPNYINPDMGEGINGFMNAGNLFVDFGLPIFPIITNYYRDLNLDEAVAQVRYTYNDVTYHREYIASYPARAMVFRYIADKKGALNFSVNPISAHPGKILVNNGEIRIVGRLKDSEPYLRKGIAGYYGESDLEYCIIVKVIADDGEVVDDYAKVNICNATGVTVVITAATDFDPDQFVIGTDGKVDVAAKQFKSKQGVAFAIEKAKQRLANTDGKTYQQLKNEHIADYQKIFRRVNFRLSNSDEICQIPTNKLQSQYRDAIPQINPGQKIIYNDSAFNALNRHLEELHFNYARYLMISSSRETSMPSTLQGKWNQSVSEIWGSAYTININLQMNYWFVGTANLMECSKALLNWIKYQIPAGRLTAANMYGIEPQKYTFDGNSITFSKPSNLDDDDVFIMHTKQGIAGLTDKTGSASIQSPGNLAFLMYNVWDLYQTSGDKQLLANELYPILKKAANFYTQYINAYKKTTANKLNYPKGYYYTTGEGRSPEQGPTQEGIKYDLQLVAGLFDYAIKAAEILNVDIEKVNVWKEIRQNIEMPIELGKNGQLKEWGQETEYNTSPTGTALGDPFHRHLSHLVGLYPGNLITRNKPEYLEGAKVVLDNRGDEATGWSIAFKMLMWARVLEGDKALDLFRYQLAQRTYPNLFGFHPPFQIDGNFGAAAGVLEMLIQSQTGIIHILPALPKAWTTGSISGIKARTGAEISIDWDNNKASEITLIPAFDEDVTLGYDLAETICVNDGLSTKIIYKKDGLFTINEVKAGTMLKITLP